MIKTRNPKTDSLSHKQETYNQIKNHLEQENATLLRERAAIHHQSQHQHTGNVDSIFAMPSIQMHQLGTDSRYPNSSNGTNYINDSTVDILREKIIEIIKICHEQYNSVRGLSLSEVAEASTQILTYLEGYEVSASEVRQNAVNQSKKERNRVNKSFNHQKSSSGQSFNQEALSFIDEIQAKALRQIDSLRRQKITLMFKLNQEIKANKQITRLCHILQNKVKILSEQKHTISNNEAMEIVAEQNEESSLHHELDEQSRRLIFGRSDPSSLNNIKAHDYQENNHHKMRKISLDIGSPSHAVHSNIIINTLNSPNSKQPSRINEIDISKEILRLQYQNEHIKDNLMTPDTHPSIKLKLRSQLGQLQGKIRFYEKALTQRQRSSKNYDVNELQSLIIQSNQISFQGKKLLQHKRPQYHHEDPERSEVFRNSIEIPSLKKQGRGTFDFNQTSREEELAKKSQLRPASHYTRSQFQSFSPQKKSRHNIPHKTEFSPTQYQNIIQEMKRATKNLL